MADVWDQLEGDMKSGMAKPKEAPKGGLSAKGLYDFYLANGATRNEALMLTGAAHSESGFNPTAKHDPDENGKPTGYGMFGHRLDRLTAMRNKYGTQAPNWQQQALFALEEARAQGNVAGILAKPNATPQELAIAQMHFERPEGYTAANPQGGKNFTGRLGTIGMLAQGQFDKLPTGGTSGGMVPEKPSEAAPLSMAELLNRDMIRLFPPSTTAPSVAPVMAAQVPMQAPALQGAPGLISSVAKGAGLNPLQSTIAGGSLALQDIKQGRPISDVLTNPGEMYSRGQNLVQDEQAEYEKAYPMQSSVANTLGEVAGATALSAGALGAIGKGAEAIGAVAPKVGPAVRTAANFLSGTGGSGPITKTLSNMAGGAVQALAGQPVTGGDVASNILTGAGVGGLTTPFVRAATAPLRDVARPDVAEAAQALRGLNVEVPGAALLPSPASRKVVEALSGKNDATAMEQAHAALATHFPEGQMAETMTALGTKGLPPKAWEKVKDNLGQKFEEFAKKADIDLNKVQPMIDADMHRLEQAADSLITKESSQAARKALEQVDNLLLDRHVNKGGILSGKDYLDLTKKDSSPIAQLLKSPDGNLKRFGLELKDTLDKALAASNPQMADKINAVRQEYRKLHVIEGSAKMSTGKDTHGLFDPQRLSRDLTEESGSFGDLGKVGAFLDKISPSGAPKPVSGLLGMLSHGGGMAGGAGLAGATMAGAEKLFDRDSNWNDPATLMAIAGGAAAGMGAKSMMGRYMGSPAYTDRIIQNTLNPKPSMVINPLIGLVNGVRQQ